MNSDSGAAAPLEKTSSRPRKQVNNQIDMYIHFFGGIYPAGVFSPLGATSLFLNASLMTSSISCCEVVKIPKSETYGSLNVSAGYQPVQRTYLIFTPPLVSEDY